MSFGEPEPTNDPDSLGAGEPGDASSAHDLDGSHEHDSAGTDSVGHDSVERTSVESTSAESEPGQHDSAEHKRAKLDVAQGESVERESAEHDSVEHDSVERDSAERESTEHDSAERESAERDSVERESAERDSAEDKPTERESGEHKPTEHGSGAVALSVSRLVKKFGDTVAVNAIDMTVSAGTIAGIVGPNGAGKTSILSMVTGLLRPDSGSVAVNGIDVWSQSHVAKRMIGVLPDRLRLFDRLTGRQLLYYCGVLRGLDARVVTERSAELAAAFGIDDALERTVADYSAGMVKKIALASAMIHSPRLLVLDEPFESVDPVSAANVIDILKKYARGGGTVVLSSHGMDLIQRVCDSVAILVNGSVLVAGTVDDVRGDDTLDERFVGLAGGRKSAEGMEWLHSFSD